MVITICLSLKVIKKIKTSSGSVLLPAGGLYLLGGCSRSLPHRSGLCTHLDRLFKRLAMGGKNLTAAANIEAPSTEDEHRSTSPGSFLAPLIKDCDLAAETGRTGMTGAAHRWCHDPASLRPLIRRLITHGGRGKARNRLLPCDDAPPPPQNPIRRHLLELLCQPPSQDRLKSSGVSRTSPDPAAFIFTWRIHLVICHSSFRVGVSSSGNGACGIISLPICTVQAASCH